MEEELLNEIKAFLIRDLDAYQLNSSDNDKRLKIIGKIDILLSNKKDSLVDRSVQDYEPLLSRTSYEGASKYSNRLSNETPYDDYNSTNGYAASSNPINIPYGGRQRTDSEQRISSAYSSMNLAQQPETQVRHTGRVTLVSGKLPKAVSGNVTYFAFLLTDRLVLFKRLKDTEPAYDITITGESTCAALKSAFRLNCADSAGKMKSYTFLCKHSCELLTWLDIINEVIRNRKQVYPSPMYADHPNWNRRFSTSDCSRRQKNRKYSMFNFFRKSPRETISHPIPSPVSPTSPIFPRGTDEGSDTFEGFLKLLYPNGDSLLRYCTVSNGFFSVYQSAETKSQAEFKFPLQCCELDVDHEAVVQNRLSFRIVQSCVVKVSCEALEKVSHFQWLKCLVHATKRSTTVPRQLLDTSPIEDALPLPDDGELDDYQIPIATKPIPREKISNFRQTMMSIHQSFCDYDLNSTTDNVYFHRSEQELHHCSAEVRRSWSTRPLYERGKRQALCGKVEVNLLPDIDRFIDKSEQWRRRRSGSAPLLSTNSSEAVYVEATGIHDVTSPSSAAYHRQSDRSSGTNYASERNTDDSSGVGLDSGGGASDDLVMSEKYRRCNLSPKKGPSPERELFEENFYEPVHLSTPYVPMEYPNDSGIDQEDGPASTSKRSPDKQRLDSDSGPATDPKPTAKPRSLSFNTPRSESPLPMVRKRDTKQVANKGDYDKEKKIENIEEKKIENMGEKKIENIEEKKIENMEKKNGANVVKDEEEVEEEVTNLDDDLSPGQGMALEEHYDELPHSGAGESRTGTLNGGSTDIKRYQKPALPPKPSMLQRRNTKSGERQSEQK